MEFLSSKNIMLDQCAGSRYEVLQLISHRAKQLHITDNADDVYKSFLDREKLGVTGMTEGFAIPHAKCAAINQAAIILFKNDKKLDWPSFDDKPVDIIIALFVPDCEAGTTHIKLLSKMAVLLMDDDFKKLVRSTSDPQGIVDAINMELEKDD
jgi:PTS system fructose-specific IIA component